MILCAQTLTTRGSVRPRDLRIWKALPSLSESRPYTFFLPLAHRRRRPALPSHSLQQIFIPLTSPLSLKYQTIPIHTKDYSSLSYFPFIIPCKDQRHSLQRPSSHNHRSGPTRRPLPFRTYIQPCTLISSSEFYSQFPLQVRPTASQKKSSSSTFDLSFHTFLDPFLTIPIRSQFPDELTYSLTRPQTSCALLRTCKVH